MRSLKLETTLSPTWSFWVWSSCKTSWKQKPQQCWKTFAEQTSALSWSLVSPLWRIIISHFNFAVSLTSKCFYWIHFFLKTFPRKGERSTQFTHLFYFFDQFLFSPHCISLQSLSKCIQTRYSYCRCIYFLLNMINNNITWVILLLYDSTICTYLINWINCVLLEPKQFPFIITSLCLVAGNLPQALIRASF